MTLEDIEKAVAHIDSIRGDDEGAHSEEDSLHVAFINYVAKREDELGLMAQAVLKTGEINFMRWCA